MPAAAVEVENLGQTIRQIKAIDPKLVEELKGANREIAEDVTQVARGLVRIDSGRLQASIRPGATARTGLVRAGRGSVPYAAVQHFGWPARNISPDPFLYDALDERREEVERRYLDALNKATEGIRD